MNRNRKAEISGSRSTSVDVGGSGLSWHNLQTERMQTDDFQNEQWLCCRPQRLNRKDAVYPAITKKLVSKHEGTYDKKKRKTRLFKSKEINPNSYISLHKIITVGKYAVYYFGTENSSEEPKTVKIYRPTFRFIGHRRSGVEKQILSLPQKPAAIPLLEFAFRYEFYKCLILEPLYNVSLKEKLLYARRLLPEVVQSFMVDMVCAIAFLHANRIIHRNLNLDSFWIQANSRLKLTDYNHCICKRSLARWNTLLGSKVTNFTAPELFSCKPYSRQTDIWALGVIFYRMTCGRFPFYAEDSKELKTNIQTAQENYPEFFTPLSTMLCSMMLQKDPSLRIGYKLKTEYAFSDHPYFFNIDWISAHSQSTQGPTIKWKFPVAQDVKNKVRGGSENLNLEDLGSFDMKTMKKRPLRMDALRDGSYMFSPEYLEQQFPRRISDDPALVPLTGRTSKAMRVSLHSNLLRAFLDLEKHMESEEEDQALKKYYSSIYKNINKYSREKKDSHREKSSTSLDKMHSRDRDSESSSGTTV